MPGRAPKLAWRPWAAVRRPGAGRRVADPMVGAGEASVGDERDRSAHADGAARPVAAWPSPPPPGPAGQAVVRAGCVCFRGLFRGLSRTLVHRGVSVQPNPQLGSCCCPALLPPWGGRRPPGGNGPGGESPFGRSMSSSSTRLPTSFSSYRAPSRRTPTQNHPPPPTPPHRGRRGRARAGCQQRASVDSSAYYLPRTRVRRRVSVLPTLQLSSSCCLALLPPRGGRRPPRGHGAGVVRGVLLC